MSILILLLLIVVLIALWVLNDNVASLRGDMHRIHERLGLLLLQERRQVKMATAFQDKIASIQASVNDLTTVEQSAIALLSQLSAAVTANKNDPAALDAILTEINTQRDSLAAAVAANTPADPTATGAVSTGDTTGTDTGGGSTTTDPSSGLDPTPTP